jgi:hypothetical protein
MRRLLPLCLLLLHPLAHGAGGFSHNVTMDPETRDSIQVSSMMDNLPTAGFMPLKVRIDNRSTADRSWSLRPILQQNEWILSSWTFPVKAGSMTEFEILVPLKASQFGYRWGAQFSWSGPGVEHNAMPLPQTSASSTSGSIPFVGMSDSLHANHWGQLQSSSSDLIGTSLDLSQAPADWRGYSGLDHIWMTSAEWRSLATDKQHAIIEAITFGSDLILVCPTAEDAAAIKASFKRTNTASRDVWYQGAGRFRLVVAAGHKLDTTSTMSIIRSGNKKAADFGAALPSGYFEKAVATVSTGGPLVLIFIVLFGVLAGPVNLFVLAPAGRRHRLFITTPIISIVGALILALSILIQDGTGGTGVRLIHAQILPDQKRLLISQEQVARTGLLLGSSFTLSDTAWVQPLTDNQASLSINQNTQFSLTANGQHTGDWFRSRTRQRHLIQTSRPSRAAIEFTSGESPSIVSTMEVTLKEIYVRAPDGSIWRAKNVTPGSRMNLTRESAGLDWWKERAKAFDLNGPLRTTTSRAEHGTAQAHFYAEAEPSPAFAIETLSSIRWETPLVLISGPLTVKP